MFELFNKRAFARSIAALAALGICGSASAHITLEAKQVAAGAGYKAVFRVPHGCDGASTIRVSVKIPEGYISVKPMPHQGWTIETVKGKYASPHDYFGAKLTDGVTEVTWKGGPLPDDYYDEFVMNGTIAADTAPGMMYFPVVQECEKGVHRWIAIPEPGKTADDYPEPAPGLKILPKN